LLFNKKGLLFFLFSGTLGGAAVGLLVYELGTYWWHRAMHGSDLLWRGFHQMHHSADRLDTYGTFWFSPLDMIGWTLLSSLCLVLVVGVTPQTATILLLAITFLAIFQHANIRTPRWLGYLIQHPESHTIHHGRGIHRFNYADLPVFDMLFGTFRNPLDFEVETGFYAGASSRVMEMLLFKDVHGARGKPE
jgi:sterol desaturase/sphingolipid hydroxylase (fatty acid hydroxylase superfamily)